MRQNPCGHIFIIDGTLLAGASTVIHRHPFDHVTYVPKGAIRFERLEPINDDATEFRTLHEVTKRALDGNNWILVPSDSWHRLTALEDSIYHCIHSSKDDIG